MDQPAHARRFSWWIGPALMALLLASLALRTWDASQGLNSRRYFDEQFPFRERFLHPEAVAPACLLPQPLVPAAGGGAGRRREYRATRYQPFSIYTETQTAAPRPIGSPAVGQRPLWSGMLSLSLMPCSSAGACRWPWAAGQAAGRLPATCCSDEFKPYPSSLSSTVPDLLPVQDGPSGLVGFLGVGLGVGLAVSAEYTGAIASAMRPCW